MSWSFTISLPEKRLKLPGSWGFDSLFPRMIYRSLAIPQRRRHHRHGSSTMYSKLLQERDDGYPGVEPRCGPEVRCDQRFSEVVSIFWMFPTTWPNNVKFTINAESMLVTTAATETIKEVWNYVFQYRQMLTQTHSTSTKYNHNNNFEAVTTELAEATTNIAQQRQ